MINHFDEFYDTNIKKLEDEYNLFVKYHKLSMAIVGSVTILIGIVLTVTNNINILTLMISFGVMCLLFLWTPMFFASKFAMIEEMIFNLLLNEFFGDLKYSQHTLEFVQMEKYMWPKGSYKFNRMNLYNNIISIVESEISRNNDGPTSEVYFKGIIIKVKLNQAEKSNIIINLDDKCEVIEEKEDETNKNSFKSNKKLFSIEEIENKELLSEEMIKKVLEYKKQIDRNTSYFIYKDELYIAIEGATIIGNSNYKGLNKNELYNNLKMLKEYLSNIEKIFLF